MPAEYGEADELPDEIDARLGEIEQALETFERRPMTFEPEQIGISRACLRDSVIRAQHIRRRFTVLDLAVRTGRLNLWLRDLFGARGIWEIK